jgi:hypothetical protein
MPEIFLRDCTPVRILKAVDQPENKHSWEDGVRWGVAFGNTFIGCVTSWRAQRARQRGSGHPKRWEDRLSYGVLQKLGVSVDRNVGRYHQTRKDAIERLVTRFTEIVKKGKR